MLSVASLLNPVKPEHRGTRLLTSPSSTSLCTSSSAHGSPLLSLTPQSYPKKPKMMKDGAIFTKGKVKGEVNFAPFERFDENVLREVQKFQIYPLGSIQQYAQHIPYNSEKKTFLEKTGRESFEVFKYVFKVPGDDKEYVVMWDYNVGLVRITPFFKCCKYSKTTPAKMLNMNPGLKDITHSITGGALVAQGYWMPYSCAMAVCTTFCSHIAGALIPIFGPTFPSLCVPPEAPEHGRMIIDAQTIHEATAEAEAFRAHYCNFSASNCSARESYSPMNSSDRERISSDISMRQTPPNLGRRLRIRRAFGGDSPSGLMTDTDFDTNASESSGDGYFLSPVTPVSTNSMLSTSYSQLQPLSQSHLHSHGHGHGHGYGSGQGQGQGQSQAQKQSQNSVHIAQPGMTGWQSHNMIAHGSNSSINMSPQSHTYHTHAHTYKGPSPFLSAIPRSTGLDIAMSGIWRSGPSKRRVEEVDADDEYDGESVSVVTDDKGSTYGKSVGASAGKVVGVGSVTPSGAAGGNGNGIDEEMEDVGDTERKAAWLLMKLSVQDREVGTTVLKGLGGGVAVTSGSDMSGGCEGPRIKRRRATSM